jgi:two-component system, NarL family, nitrate/nitrite response regulator NarL
MGKGRPTIHVLLADSHSIFREGLRGLLESESDLRVVAEAGDGFEALNLARLLQPDLMLLDLVLPRVQGNDVLRQLAGGGQPVTRVVFLTSVRDKSRLTDAVRLGAHGVVFKDQSVKVLIRCIRKVMQAQYWIGMEAYPDSSLAIQSLTGPVVPPAASPRWGLTKREQEMIGSVVSGYTNKEISLKYGISEDTVKHHLSSVFDKLGVYNRLELALFALHHGLVGKSQSPVHPPGETKNDGSG